MKKAAGFALIKTIPVFLGYIFLGIAFGLLLQKAGLGAGWAFLISLFVYAGSMQFALFNPERSIYEKSSWICPDKNNPCFSGIYFSWNCLWPPSPKGRSWSRLGLSHQSLCLCRFHAVCPYRDSHRRAEFCRNSHHDAFDQQPTRILWPDLY